MTTKPKRETIKLAPYIADALRARNPDGDNLSYLANCKLAEALGLPMPETHDEARKRGGRTGGRGRGNKAITLTDEQRRRPTVDVEKL